MTNISFTIVKDSDLTKEELEEEELQAKTSEIEKRLKDKSGSVDAMELLKEFDKNLT